MKTPLQIVTISIPFPKTSIGSQLATAALIFGLAAPIAIQSQTSSAAGKTIKTNNLSSVPSSARPALMRAVRQLAARAGQPGPMAQNQDIPDPQEMNLICGGDDWLVWWDEDANGNIEDGSIHAACGTGTKIDVPTKPD